MRSALTRASLSLSTTAVTVAALLAGVVWTVLAAPPAYAATSAAPPASGFYTPSFVKVQTAQPGGYPNGGATSHWSGSMYLSKMGSVGGNATCDVSGSANAAVDVLYDSGNNPVGASGTFSCPAGQTLTSWFFTAHRTDGSDYTLRWDQFSGPDGQYLSAADNPAAKSKPHCSCGDPVDTASGEFYETLTDLHMSGRGGDTGWSRTYGSLNAAANSPLGYGWSAPWLTHLTFAGNGNPTIVQENGSAVPFTAQPDGSFKAPFWANITAAHNADGTWTVVRKRTTVLTFNAAGQLLTKADLNGNTTTLGYTAGRPTTVTAPSGRVLTFGWDTSNTHITSVTDQMGQHIGYGYNATTGDLTSYTDPTLNVWTYGYNSRHQITTVTSPRGGVTTNVWDAQGRVSSQTDQVNKTTTFAYGQTGAGDPQTRVTDPSGVVTALTYSGSMLMQKTVNPDSTNPHVTTYRYDPATSALVGEVDGNGVGWAAQVDNDGNVTARTDGDGNTTTATFNQWDEPTSVTDPQNTTSTLTYDGRANLTSITRPLTGGATPTSAVTAYHHDDLAHPGDLTSITDPRGKTTTITYASTTGDLTSATDATGAKTTFGYNSNGWRTSTTTPEGNKPGANAAAFTTTLGFDAGGNPISSTDGLGNVTRAAYDADYNKVRTVTPDQHATVIDYDLSDRPTVVHQPNNATTSTTYDPAGRVASQVDGNTNTTTYLYDGFGDLASSTTPNNKTTTYTHDAGGLLATIVDPDQRTTTQTWDPAGHLVGVVYSDGTTPNVTYTFDTLGRRSSMTDGTGTTTWSYDLASRPTSITDASGTVGYGWDANSNLVSLTYPDGKTLTRSYDDANRWTGMVDPAGKQFTFGYNANTDLTSLAYPNTVTDTRTFDSTDRLTGIVDTTSAATAVNPTLLTVGYDYNASSQQVAEHIRQVGNYDAITGYDGNDRLGAFTTQLGPTTSNGSFGYDSASNLTAMPLATTQTFNTADQITGRTDSTGNTTYGFNNEGQRTSQTLTPAAVTRTPVTITGAVTAARNWQINGSATGGTTATLTPATANQTGSVFYKNALPSNDLHATFTASLTGGSGGDGLTLALIDSTKNTPTSVGGGGGALGFDGLDGTAVALDTYENQTIEPSNNFAAIRTSTSNPSNPASADVGYRMNAVKVPNLRSGTHAIKVDTAPNRLTVNIDGTQVLNSQVNLPPNVYVGFTAANGGATDTHAVSNVVIKSGTSTTPAATTVGYGYDQAGRLTTYTPPTGATAATTYRYNGDGLRLSKTTGSGGTAQKFGWDRSGSLPTILTDSAWDYVYGPQGQPLEQIKAAGGQVDYLHVDAHNTVRLITDGTGANIGTATYNPYGAPFATANTETSALGYDGQYTDAESGLIYLRARMYDPNAGQFLTRDPLAAVTGDPYGYAGQDPVNLDDPTGLWSVLCSLKSAGSWAFHHVGTIATVVSIGVCVAASFGACAGVAVAALAARIVQRGMNDGWRDSIGADVQDALLSAVTLGYGGAVAAGMGEVSLGQLAGTAIGKAFEPNLPFLVTKGINAIAALPDSIFFEHDNAEEGLHSGGGEQDGE